MLLFFKTIDMDNRKRLLLSIFLAFLYACTDEIHQLFVPGRSGEIKDVCIDTCGAFIGALIVYGISKISKNRKKLSNMANKNI